MSRKRPFSATNDVRTMGGKELVLNRLVNHYKAISNAKPFIKIEQPHKHVDANRNYGSSKKHFEREEFHNVRQTYKGVANVKPMVDVNKPVTFNMGKKIKNQKANEKFEDFEHIRRLNAMSKRILSLGKPHERKKNIYDPIANPTYFFRTPGDEKAIKLVSLDKFTQRLNKLNEYNKMFLGATVYNVLGVTSPSSAGVNTHSNADVKSTMNRPKSANNFNSNEAKVYTHIHTDPLTIIKQHVKERVKTTKQKEEELLNLTKNSIPISILNKSSSFSKLNIPLIPKSVEAK